MNGTVCGSPSRWSQPWRSPPPTGVALGRLLIAQPAGDEDLAEVLEWFGGRGGNRARRAPWAG